MKESLQRCSRTSGTLYCNQSIEDSKEIEILVDCVEIEKQTLKRYREKALCMKFTGAEMNLNRWPPIQISSDPRTGICPRDQSSVPKNII